MYRYSFFFIFVGLCAQSYMWQTVIARPTLSVLCNKMLTIGLPNTNTPRHQSLDNSPHPVLHHSLSSNLHCISKNDTDLACYNSDVDQPILIVFGRSVAEVVSYQLMIYLSASPGQCLCTTWGNMNHGKCLTSMLYRLLHTLTGTSLPKLPKSVDTR